MGFQEAQAAMSAEYGGGKVDPGRLDYSTGKAPDTTPVINNRTEDVKQTAEASAPETSEPQELTQEALEDMLDLSLINKKIKIGDEVLTLEELKRSLLRHKDYTKKTQDLAKERKSTEEFQKYSQAFEEDLETLLSDPDTYEEQFREIYPPQFQKIYDRIKATRTAQKSYASTREETAQMPIPPELKGVLDTVSRLENRVSTYERQAKEAQTEKEAARLDGVFTKLHTQYDLGDAKHNEKLENLVLARAQMLGRDPTDQDLGKFFKEEYDSMTGFAKAYGEKQFRSQKAANSQAKDTASGGGISTGSPQGLKTFKEAREAMTKHLGGS